jgi:hypothetical protein
MEVMRYRASEKFFFERRRGQSLVELVVYTGLVVVISAVVTTMLVAMQRAIAQTVVSRRIHAAASVVLERIVRDARVAYDINELASTLGTHPGRVTLLVRGSGGGPDVAYEFTGTGSTIEVRRDGVLQGALVPDNVDATNLVFRQIATPVSTALRIELTLHAEQGHASGTERFYTTAVLRDVYNLQ